jgi:hypothetical protein
MFHCGTLGGASVCLPADEQTLVPPQRRSRRHPEKISAPPRLCVKKLSTFNAQLPDVDHAAGWGVDELQRHHIPPALISLERPSRCRERALPPFGQRRQ